MRKQPDARIFFGLAGLALVVGGGLMYSEYGSVSENRDQVDALQKEVDSANGIQKSLAESETRLTDFKTKLAHLERGVPDYRYIPTMLKELEEFGNQNGIKVLGVRPIIVATTAKPDTKETRQPYQEQSIEVKGRGNYGDCLRFLKSLHRFPKIVAARAVSLAPRVLSTDDPFASPNLEMTVELKVFVFGDKDPAVEGETSKTDSAVASEGVATNG